MPVPDPRRLAVPASLSLLAAAVFAAWMHPAVLDPRNVGWLLDGQDRGESAIGLAAYLRAGGPWPLLHQPLLDAPEGLTLLFTDSIPLLGLLLKPFAGLMGQPLQFLGPWYLLCVALQTAVAWAILRPRSPDALAAWLGTALLAAFPVLLNRYGHASLCAQWLVLAALGLFIDERKRGRDGWWTALVAVAALVHSYLLVMVGAIWASALLRRLVEQRDRARALASALPVLAVVAGAALLHGAVGGHYDSTGTYGAFPMALDAWWNPANPGYTALLPSSPEDHGRGFEGFQYLGAGLLFLAIVAAALAWRGERPAAVRRLRWLVPALLVLAVIAIGPQPIWRGQPLWTLHLPARLTDALDPVRAAGRLMWPATYAIALAAILVVLRHRSATLLLGAALALQVIDLAPMAAAIRATSARADDPRTFTRTRDPRWATAIARASSIEIEPARPFVDLQLSEEIGWRAVAVCRPVRFVYAAREEARTRARIDADTAAFHAGRLDPTRLYVLLDGRAPASARSFVRRLDGVAIIPPRQPSPPPACQERYSASSRSP